jgi:acyl phosphate:glycerol-3-phosphate acyltransferase
MVQLSVISFHASSTIWAMAAVLAAYALGCFSTGFFYYKWRTGRDIRDFGSGNAGARNVGRALGRTGFFVTFLGDFGKGMAATGLARLFHLDPWVVVGVLVAVVAGHNWPAPLHFRGGKGMATSGGAILFFDLTLTACSAAAFVVIWIALRRTTLSGLLACAVAPVLLWIFKPEPPLVVGASILALEVLIAHHSNVREEIMRLGLRRG